MKIKVPCICELVFLPKNTFSDILYFKRIFVSGGVHSVLSGGNVVKCEKIDNRSVYYIKGDPTFEGKWSGRYIRNKIMIVDKKEYNTSELIEIYKKNVFCLKKDILSTYE